MAPSSGSESSPRKLSPFVYWAQSENQISLRVNLQTVSAPDIITSDKGIGFLAQGIGANGKNQYAFSLEFFKDIDSKSEKISHKATSVEIYYEKKESSWWPRLTKDSTKLPWLKLDFDKLKTSDDEEEEDRFDEEDTFDLRSSKQDTASIMSQMRDRQKKYQQRVEGFRRAYLFLYNFTQFIGFFYVFLVLNAGYSHEGPGFMEHAFESVSTTFHFVQLFQLLEIIHPLLGYTSGSALGPTLQVFGRLTVLLLQIDAEPRIQTKPAVFYLLNVYAISEIIRYPYYMLKVYNMDLGLLTWLRYTVWIPLYPLGFLCEGIIILRNIPHFEETKKFSFFLPNAWNISFYYPTFMRLYLLTGLFPLLYFMMTYMYRQRKKVLGVSIKRD